MDEPDLSAMDPQARRVLAMVGIGGARDAVPDAARRREAFVRLMRFSRAPAATVDVAALRTGGAAGLALRLYTPAASAHIGPGRVGPGLIYFHGGGLVAGGLDTHDALCRTLAHGSGCRIVAVDYRLAPEHPFPAAVVDALLATRWVLRHAPEIGLDRDRIGVGGDSGGGTLAAIAAQVLRRRLRAQVLLCPVLDCVAAHESRRRFADGFLLDAATMAADLVHYAPQRPLEDPRLSPLRAERLDDCPPAVLHTAGFDPLVDEGDAYARRLAEAGVAVTHVRHPGLVHHFYALDGVVPAARDALARIGRDIAAALA